MSGFGDDGNLLLDQNTTGFDPTARRPVFLTVVKSARLGVLPLKRDVPKSWRVSRQLVCRRQDVRSASIIPCRNAIELSNNIIQKGLAFGRDRSGSVANPERMRAPRSCPAGSMAEVGLRWCGATPPSTETEDLHVKVCKEAITSASTRVNDCRKAVAAGNGQSPSPA